MEEMPFRHCAMMLKVEPCHKLKSKKIDQQKTEKIETFLKEELWFFDRDCAPKISLDGEISLPVKAFHHIRFEIASNNDYSYFELGIVSQQVLLYLEYLKLKYCLIFLDDAIVVPFSSEGIYMPVEKKVKGYARKQPLTVREILFFEKWGDHPEDFLENNPKLESILHYCRFAPVINGSNQPKFIMNKEFLHLVTVSEGSRRLAIDLTNAGFILLNYILSARLLGLKGEWKLMREIDKPEKELFALPDNAVHIATWHGQLF